MTFGQRLKATRVAKQLTQKDLADALNVTFQTVSKWENDENEPDFKTLDGIADTLGCTVAYLLGKEQTNSDNLPVAQETKKICHKCGKEITDDEYEVENYVIPKGKTRRIQAQRYYHKECYDQVQEEKKAEVIKKKKADISGEAKKCWIWGICAGALSLIASLLVFFLVPQLKNTFEPIIKIVISLGISYAFFASLYCIVSGSYIGDVFFKLSTTSIRFPGIIFSWSIDGFAFLIVMKILFAIIAFLFGIVAAIFAVALTLALSAVSFPFVVIYNVKEGYSDTL